MQSLMYLLQAQMQIQHRAIESSVELLKDSNSSSGLNQLPGLLSRSASLIQSTASSIMTEHEARERRLLRRLRRETEQRKRWQDVVQRVVGLPPSTPEIASLSPDIDDTVTEGDIFYDFDDDDADQNSQSNFYLVSALGLEPLDATVRTSVTTENQPLSASSLNELYEDISQTGFISLDNIMLLSVGYENNPRTRLPLDPNVPKPTLAVWSFLKSAIGKDLTKISLPVIFNEPLSMLQRIAEDVEYSELLSLAGNIGSFQNVTSIPALKAAKSLNIDISKIVDPEEISLHRLMFVAAFAMSNYSTY
jgi:hypothetical protein